MHCIKAFTNLSSAEPHNKVMRNMGRFCYCSYFTNKEIEAWPRIRGSYPKCKLKLRACIWIQIFWLWSPWSFLSQHFFPLNIIALPYSSYPHTLFCLPDIFLSILTWDQQEATITTMGQHHWKRHSTSPLPTVHSGLTGPQPCSSYRARDAQLRMELNSSILWFDVILNLQF